MYTASLERPLTPSQALIMIQDGSNERSTLLPRTYKSLGEGGIKVDAVKVSYWEPSRAALSVAGLKESSLSDPRANYLFMLVLIEESVRQLPR